MFFVLIWAIRMARLYQKRMTHEVHDDFAVGMCLEHCRLLEVFPKQTMVVDLAIDCQDNAAVLVDERLSSRICRSVSVALRARTGIQTGEPVRTNAYDGQSLVTQNAVVCHLAAAPIRTAMPQTLRERKCSATKARQILLVVSMRCKDTAHDAKGLEEGWAFFDSSSWPA